MSYVQEAADKLEGKLADRGFDQNGIDEIISFVAPIWREARAEMRERCAKEADKRGAHADDCQCERCLTGDNIAARIRALGDE
jgi:hypothetical protein